jgi:hypothetical protein
MTTDAKREYHRDWYQTQKRLNTESYQHHLQTNRERQARKRADAKMAKAAAMAGAEFTLHDLACPYPELGCACRVLIVLVTP